MGNPQRSDIENYTELKDVDLKVVDQPVGLLLGADVTDAYKTTRGDTYEEQWTIHDEN